jgi:hypothetical protein
MDALFFQPSLRGRVANASRGDAGDGGDDDFELPLALRIDTIRLPPCTGRLNPRLIQAWRRLLVIRRRAVLSAWGALGQ